MSQDEKVENVGRRLSRQVPWGLIGMIPFVWAIEGFTTRHAADFLGTHPGVGGRPRSPLEAETAGRDLLIFGDSQVKFGLLPGVIEKRTGLSGYNLAVLGGMPASSYGLLRGALQSGRTAEGCGRRFRSRTPRFSTSSQRGRFGRGSSIRPRLW